MTTENNQPVPEGVVQNPEVTKAEIALSLSKEGLAYQSILQEGNNIALTRDNLESEKPKFDLLVKVEKELKDLENPFTSRWKSWNEARQSLLKPVSELVTKNRSTLTKIANEIAAEKKKAEDEAARVKAIKDAIDTFFIEQSNAIAVAKTPEELTRIQKLIGSNKTASSKYGAEFLPLVAEKALKLDDLIKAQKSALKELQGLETAENASDEEILDATEKKEQITAKIEQTKQEIQSKALNMATEAETVVVPEMVLPDVKAKRRTWDWEINDLAALYKKAPELVELTANKEAIKAILKKKVEDGETKGITEFYHLCIKFFVKATY